MYLVFDGGNHGHKVQAGYGSFKLFDEKGGKLLAYEQREYSGFMTNNEAEYRTLQEALEYIAAHHMTVIHLHIEGDSELVRNQVLGNWQVSKKGQHLKPYLNKIQSLLQSYVVTYLHVPRQVIVEFLGH